MESNVHIVHRLYGTDIIFTTAALGLRVCSPITSGISGAKSYNLSEEMSKEGPKNVPGNGAEGAQEEPAWSMSGDQPDAIARVAKAPQKEHKRSTISLSRSKYISILADQPEMQMSGVIRRSVVPR